MISRSIKEFANKVPFFGSVIAVWKTLACRAFFLRSKNKVLTYGF
jgi:hypothetical protein